jgi:microcystin-dependent protein
LDIATVGFVERGLSRIKWADVDYVFNVDTPLAGTVLPEIDGEPVGPTGRFLLRNQDDLTLNGIYDMTGEPTNWVLTRSADANAAADFYQGKLVTVAQGSLAGVSYRVKEQVAELGVSLIAYGLATQSDAVFTESGETGLFVTDGVSTEYEVFHGLDSLNILTEVYRAADGQRVHFGVRVNHPDRVTLSAAAVPPAGLMFRMVFLKAANPGVPTGTVTMNDIRVGAGMDWWGAELPDETWVWADGSWLDETEDFELYQILGHRYDGTAVQTGKFRLPDKRGRVSVTAGKGDNLLNRTLADKFGTETHTLVFAEVPVHYHPTALSNITAYASTNTQSVYRTANTGNGVNVGNGVAHNNLQPSLVCNYVIKRKATKIAVVAPTPVLPNYYKPVIPSFEEKVWGPLWYYDADAAAWQEKVGFVKLFDYGPMPDTDAIELPHNILAVQAVSRYDVQITEGGRAYTDLEGTIIKCGMVGVTVDTDRDRSDKNLLVTLYYVCTDR